jgi:hypothetical protein
VGTTRASESLRRLSKRRHNRFCSRTRRRPVTRMGRRPAAWFAIALLLVCCHPGSSGSDGDRSLIVDRNGQGALVYAPGARFGVDKSIASVGDTWSAGSVTLCKKSAATDVTLKRVDPVTIRGEVRLDGIGARTTHYGDPDGHSNPNSHLVGTMRGTPKGLRSPSGFRVVTTCPTSAAPVGELVATLTKTGPEGGSLDGLRILYEAGGQTHELTIQFHFGLCGSGQFAVPCSGRV